MKNFVVLLMALALIGGASAQYSPNTWGFATPGAGNPYTFDGPDGSEVTAQTPDVWGTWGTADGGGADNGANTNIVSGGAVTIDTEGYEVVFSHDNALQDLGSPAPVAGDDLEVVLQVLSVSGPGYVSMKIEYYDSTDAFANNDNGLDMIGVADFEAEGAIFQITTAGEHHFLTSDISGGFPIPAGTVAVTPVITVAGGAVGNPAIAVIDEIWIGKPGEYPGATKASSPSPANGSIQPSDSVTGCTWVLPEPFDGVSNLTVTWTFEEETCVDGLGKAVFDPNFGGCGTTTITKTGTNKALQNFGFATNPYGWSGSAAEPLADGLYSWRVDVTDPSVGGPGTTTGTIWTFKVGDAPVDVNQPADQYMYVSQTDGDGDSNIRTFTVEFDYTDDGKSEITAIDVNNLNWGWDPLGPDGTVDTGDEERGVELVSTVYNPTPPHTFPPGGGTGTVTATFKTHYDAVDPNYSTEIMGYWDIRLEVTDATGTTLGTAGHHEIWDLCGEAAAADPADPLYQSIYDADNDCEIGLSDFQTYAALWLEQSVLLP